MHGWKRNGWSKAGGGSVLNRNLWEALDLLNGARKAKGPVRLEVHPRTLRESRQRARRRDRGCAYSLGQSVDLFDGPLDEYGVDVAEVQAESVTNGSSGGSSSSSASKASGPKGKPVYLSLIEGVLQRHATWKECEARVKGKPNARFRKATSPSEEAAILAGWGVSR